MPGITTIEITDETAALNIADSRGTADFAALAAVLTLLGRNVRIVITHDDTPQAATTPTAQPHTTTAADGQDNEPLDVLADVASILGDAKRMPAREVMQRLAENDESYRGISPQWFRREMARHGAEHYLSNGIVHVSGDRVRAALAARTGESR